RVAARRDHLGDQPRPALHQGSSGQVRRRIHGRTDRRRRLRLDHSHRPRLPASTRRNGHPPRPRDVPSAPGAVQAGPPPRCCSRAARPRRCPPRRVGRSPGRRTPPAGPLTAPTRGRSPLARAQHPVDHLVQSGGRLPELGDDRVAHLAPPPLGVVLPEGRTPAGLPRAAAGVTGAARTRSTGGGHRPARTRLVPRRTLGPLDPQPALLGVLTGDVGHRVPGPTWSTLSPASTAASTSARVTKRRMTTSYCPSSDSIAVTAASRAARMSASLPAIHSRPNRPTEVTCMRFT